MRSRVIALLLVAALIVVAVIVFAAPQRGPKQGAPGAPGQCPMGQPGPGGCGIGLGIGCGPELMRELKLTPQQIQEMQALKERLMADAKPIREQLQAKCREMCALWIDGDAAAIKAAAADMDAVRAEMRDLAIDYAIQARNILTPAQRDIIKNKISKSPCCAPGQNCGNCPGCFCCGMGMCPGMGPGMGPGKGGPGPGMGPGNGGCRPGGCPLGNR